MTSVLRLFTVHLTTLSTVLGQARRRARENPRTSIASEILHADGGPIAGIDNVSGGRACSRLLGSHSQCRERFAAPAPLQVAVVVAGRSWLVGEQAFDPSIARGCATHGSKRAGASCRGRVGQTGWAEMITWSGS
jgi:hypothetical protein